MCVGTGHDGECFFGSSSGVVSGSISRRVTVSGAYASPLSSAFSFLPSLTAFDVSEIIKFNSSQSSSPNTFFAQMFMAQ